MSHTKLPLKHPQMRALLDGCHALDTDAVERIILEWRKEDDPPLPEAILYVAMRQRSTKLWEILLKYDLPIDGTTDLEDKTLLGQSMENYDLVQWLLAHGADPNVMDKTEVTPIVRAARYGTPETLSLLITHGARVENRALLAAATSHIEAIGKMTLLLDHGAEINSVSLQPPWMINPQYRRPSYKGTALHEAGRWGFTRMEKFLLDKDADATVLDSNGLTPSEAKAKNKGRSGRGWLGGLYSHDPRDKSD